MENSGNPLQNNYGDVFSSYDFKLTTPWKFGLSLGTTVGDYLALGAEYEYADYSSTDTRINTGYDWYYDTESSSSDREMNDHTEKTLKGVGKIRRCMKRTDTRMLPFGRPEHITVRRQTIPTGSQPTA